MRARRRLVAGVLALVLVGSAEPADAQERPEFTAPVVDAADVVPDDVEEAVSAELIAYEQRSSNQIAVAVVETTGDESLEDYTIDLAREWGVGTEGDDDGVLVLIAYEDRRLRIEVGRGLEGELTDLESGRIIREQMTPRLREGDVGGAIQAGTAAIRQALGDEGAVVPTTEPTEDDDRGGFPWPFLLFGLFGLLSIGGGFGRRHRRGWGFPLVFGPGLGGWGGGGWGGGGGGGFGGFGGGGGGGFGGGGASGDW